MEKKQRVKVEKVIADNEEKPKKGKKAKKQEEETK